MASSRRSFLLGTLAWGGVMASATSRGHAKDTPIDITWTDLVPDSGEVSVPSLLERGVVQHGEMNTPSAQQDVGQVTEAYNGKLVRIPGYLVPLDYSGTGVTSALLVPYVGACIHVPPPPPNQLIFVTIGDPYQSNGLFEPVYVTGIFGTAATSTQLADVGYAISADTIEPYG